MDILEEVIVEGVVECSVPWGFVFIVFFVVGRGWCVDVCSREARVCCFGPHEICGSAFFFFVLQHASYVVARCSRPVPMKFQYPCHCRPTAAAIDMLANTLTVYDY